ncbi:hypothetical protein MLD38_001884 [Melastoma candidum]|uniref:Uncharacterized protein n=1 Tax=Melastoma candidum TaxID=119954 RepID=A0ACB9SEM8_9MYRT|nr:hypothetical protein MLD38_001884 [Melastoma candidum]
MAMRELVIGGAACVVPGSSGSVNPLGALANALIGSSSKTQERLNEIPTAAIRTSDSQVFRQGIDHLGELPGTEADLSVLPPNAPGSEFLSGFSSTDQGGLGAAWNEIQGSNVPSVLHELRFGTDPRLPPPVEGPRQRVLSGLLHSFVGSSRGGKQFRPTQLPRLGLSEGDKQCIRDRSTIMARHFFDDKSEDFINAQVNMLLQSLDIDVCLHAKGLLPGRFRETENYWNESQGFREPGPLVVDSWAAEFDQTRMHDPDAWVHSFEKQRGADGWASDFEQEYSQLSNTMHRRRVMAPNLAAMEQSRMLADTLAQQNDPKFQNSQFLHFMPKMSHGDLIFDDYQVKPTPGDWATEFQQQQNGSLSWANEYLHQGPDQWANEFSIEREQKTPLKDQWVNEFSKLHVDDWANEFSKQVADGTLGDKTADNWANSYSDFMNEQIAAKRQSGSSRGLYVFSDMNPYVGHPNPLKEGQELFLKGVLSEAILALEAEVIKNHENSEGWRLLGIAHAENDDDQQAIAAMMKAQEADPTNLEVLLALGVSHANELEKAAALRYLYGWLHHHPKYRTLAPPAMPEVLSHAYVARLFQDASRMSPRDADVHIILGVLYNLSREYDKSIASFQTALKLKPNDYSLWNKLGATQANSIQSTDAILAYQKALDLKPNYVRAWTNMGISYANQGMYEDSIRYYVRALVMNPKADNAWQYLRISLSNALRDDMMEACDSRNLDVLQNEFPL